MSFSGYVDLPAFGAASWKDPVATAAALPADNNLPGDTRVTLDTDSVYVWSGIAWQVIGSGSSGITQLTGDVTAGPGSGSQVATIASSAVSNAKMANMATQTIKGRTTAGSGSPEDLTATQATAILNTFATSTKGLVPGPSAAEVTATKVLQADGTWALKAPHGNNITWLVQGGRYNTLQDAIDATAANGTILVGPGSWGDGVLKGQVDIFGLNVDQSPLALLGNLSFAPSSGTAVQNSVNISRIYCTRLTVGGSAPSRVFMYNSRIVNSVADATPVMTTTAPSGSSLYIDDSQIGADSGHTGTIFSLSDGYCRIRRTIIYGADIAVSVSSGFVELNNCSAQYVKAGTHIMSVTAGVLYLGNDNLIENVAANASGINVGASGVLASTRTFWNVSAGTGYCVTGSGTFYHGFSLFNDITGAATNYSFNPGLTVRSFRGSGIRLPLGAGFVKTDANGDLSASATVSNSELADVATLTFKGRTTAGTGSPEDLTVSQAQAALGILTESQIMARAFARC